VTLAAAPVALPETVRGLPLHPLLVHGVVVLVPLVALGALMCVARPAARRHFGGLVVLGALVATGLVPLATGSGESFRRTLGAEELVRSHANWADRMLPVMLVLLVAVVGLVGVDILRRGGQDEALVEASPRPAGQLTVLDRQVIRLAPVGWRGRTATRPLRLATLVLALVTTVAAVLALYVVFQTGETGARAVWGGR
jgi:uncharacterized membrane protein